MMYQRCILPILVVLLAVTVWPNKSVANDTFHDTTIKVTALGADPSPGMVGEETVFSFRITFYSMVNGQEVAPNNVTADSFGAFLNYYTGFAGGEITSVTADGETYSPNDWSWCVFGPTPPTYFSTTSVTVDVTVHWTQPAAEQWVTVMGFATVDGESISDLDHLWVSVTNIINASFSRSLRPGISVASANRAESVVFVAERATTTGSGQIDFYFEESTGTGAATLCDSNGDEIEWGRFNAGYTQVELTLWAHGDSLSYVNPGMSLVAIDHDTGLEIARTSATVVQPGLWATDAEDENFVDATPSVYFEPQQQRWHAQWGWIDNTFYIYDQWGEPLFEQWGGLNVHEQLGGLDLMLSDFDPRPEHGANWLLDAYGQANDAMAQDRTCPANIQNEAAAMIWAMQHTDANIVPQTIGHTLTDKGVPYDANDNSTWPTESYDITPALHRKFWVENGHYHGIDSHTPF